jgi:hypothetical protein
MALQDMRSNPLWAGPSGVAEGTLAPLLVLVSGMPFQFLGSWIHFAARGTVIQLSVSLATVLGDPRASQVRILSSRLGH